VEFLKASLGSLDQLARTGVAVLVYVLGSTIAEGVTNSTTQFLIGEAVAAALALVVSAVLSVRGYSRPRVELKWTFENLPFTNSVMRYETRKPDEGRVICIRISRPPGSLLGAWIWHKLGDDSALLSVSIRPAGAFRITEEFAPDSTEITFTSDGFQVAIPGVKRAGNVTTLDLGLRLLDVPSSMNSDVECGLAFPNAHTWHARLVKVDSNISSIEVVRINS
jgi:hypothetical protein